MAVRLDAARTAGDGPVHVAVARPRRLCHPADLYRARARIRRRCLARGLRGRRRAEHRRQRRPAGAGALSKQAARDRVRIPGAGVLRRDWHPVRREIALCQRVLPGPDACPASRHPDRQGRAGRALPAQARRQASGRGRPAAGNHAHLSRRGRRGRPEPRPDVLGHGGRAGGRGFALGAHLSGGGARAATVDAGPAARIRSCGEPLTGDVTNRSRGQRSPGHAATDCAGPRAGRPGPATTGSAARPPIAAVPAGRGSAWSAPSPARSARSAGR